MAGIDVLFVGLTGLATSLGFEPHTGSAEFGEALESVVAAARRQDKGVGILARNEEQAREYRRLAFSDGFLRFGPGDSRHWV